jgi:hypothetical protein
MGRRERGKIEAAGHRFGRLYRYIQYLRHPDSCGAFDGGGCTNDPLGLKKLGGLDHKYEKRYTAMLLMRSACRLIEIQDTTPRIHSSSKSTSLQTAGGNEWQNGI